LVWRLLGELAALLVAQPLDGMACNALQYMHVPLNHCCSYPPSFLQAGCLAACCSRRSPRGGAPPSSSRRPAAAGRGPCCVCRRRWRLGVSR
jgi:hypothetical protein